MFDSHLNWNSMLTNSNMLTSPWVLSAINPNTDATRMVVQVQTQSSSYAANPEGSLLSTNTIEWFSAGSQPQGVVPPNAILDADYKPPPDGGLVSYSGANSAFMNSNTNNSFLNANNALVALPSPANQANVPAILTLTVPSMDFSRSVVLQALAPNFPRNTSHDQSSYMTRIIRNVPIPDTIAMVQGSTGQLLPPASGPTFLSPLTPNIGQCVRMPFMGGATMPSITEIPQAPQAQNNTWVMVVPNKDDAIIENEKVGTTSYITELPETCSTCGSTMTYESSQFSSGKKCSTCIETAAITECTPNNEGLTEQTDVAIKECACQNAEDKLNWNGSPCERCKNTSSFENLETYESDATCQVITTTTVEAAIQATADIEPCLDSTFDSEHEEFEPTSQAITSILRKLLEEEIENPHKQTTSGKTLGVFDLNEAPMDNSSFIDLNQTIEKIQDECAGPTTGVKDVLMTGTSSSVKRQSGSTQSRPKKIKTGLETGMRRPTCSKCGDKFSSSLNLRKHYMGNTNDKNYQCGKCKQTFSDCYSYKRHSWTHDKEGTGEGPSERGNISESSEDEGIQPYGCAQCGKEFSDCFLLAEHCATHLRGRPFTCTQCDMCFESVALLEKHTKLHVRTKTVLFNGYEAESESSSD